MSGVAVIRSLLAGNAGVIAIVPAAKIMASDVPINTVLPAIAVTQISSIQRLTIRMNETKQMNTDRVQVSVLLKGPQGTPPGLGYPGVRALLILVLAACPNQRGTINGIVVDSIVPDTSGPDLYDDPISLYSGSRDFVVRWLGP
jgi:hypothetical protein